jgi:hypothetical protein
MALMLLPGVSVDQSTTAASQSDQAGSRKQLLVLSRPRHTSPIFLSIQGFISPAVCAGPTGGVEGVAALQGGEGRACKGRPTTRSASRPPTSFRMMLMQPGIILLREGTDTSQGKPQLISNINACQAIVDTVRTTLGPRGMDKLIHTGDAKSGKVIISNDGATILKQLDIVHPAAKTLVEIAKSQDEEVGDGTTSVVVIAGEILSQAKGFVEEVGGNSFLWWSLEDDLFCKTKS